MKSSLLGRAFWLQPRLPDDLVDRIRLLYLACSWVLALALIPDFILGTGAVWAKAESASALVLLCAYWTFGYRRGRLPVWLEPFEGALLWAVSITAGTGVFSLAVALRATYDDGRRVVLRTLVFISALTVHYITSPSTSGTTLPLRMVQIAPTLIVFTLVTFLMTRALGHRRELQESELRFRSLVENSSDVIMVVGVGGEVVFHTPSTGRTLGYGDRALVGTKLAAILHPDDALPAQEFLRDAALGAGDRGTEWRVLHHDGMWLHVDVMGNGVLHDPQISGVVLTLRNVTERKALENRLEHQATHDPLTDLPNRLLLNEELVAALGRARGGAASVGVLFIDLDDFKLVNDTLGHVVGDQLLVKVGQRIAETLRSGDLAARLGGDEFAVVSPLPAPGAAEVLAARLSQTLGTAFEIAGNTITVRASIGIATGASGTSADQLMRQADIAMYAAKAHGKARYEVYQEAMGQTVRREASVAADLGTAIEHGQLVLHYQPIIELGGGETIGVEALVRWEHPERGLVPPNDFIPVAEQTGLIVPLGRWVMRTACEQAQAWQQRYGRALSMAVNVSPRQLRETDFVAHVAATLEKTGFDPKLLIVEITESLFLQDSATARQQLTRLRALGVRIALDDFGTGYSSIAYLHDLPIDSIKLDRSFIAGVGVDEKKTALARAVAEFAATLGLDTVAEGIETTGQRDAVNAFGYRYGQGYLFAKPLTATAFAESIERDAIKPGLTSRS
jgi:diguanylate cyclase (GGDEF)-like protein/PAS domain S-box-containing protein